MKNIVGYYQFMMQHSLPLKITSILVLLSFPLSIIFTIVCLSLNCSYSTLYQPCSYLANSNPNECNLNGQPFCCGTQGNLVCQDYLNCILKPQNQSISTCQGLLITSWILYLVFIVSTIVFFVLHRKLGPQIADDYTRMSQDIEITHQSSQNGQQNGIGNSLL